MKRPFGTRIIPAVMRSFAACGMLLAAGTPSFGVIIGSYFVNPDNTVTYTYEVDNSAGAFDIFSWALEFGIVPDWNQSEAPLGDVATPNLDWIALSGIPTAGGVSAQDFTSLSPAGDVLIGGTLGGFSFTSAFLPGPISYFEFSAIGESATAETIGPAVARTNVPEGGRGMEAIALLSLAALSVRKRNQERAEAARA